MKVPKATVAYTMIGAAAFGRMCCSKILLFDAPRAFAAITYSSFFTLITAPRVMRAMEVQPKMPSTSTTVTMVRCSLNICITTMAASTSGMAKKMSVMRDSTESRKPPM